MRRLGAVGLALAVAALALIVLVGVQLTHHADRLAGSNFVAPTSFVTTAQGQDARVCQPVDRLYAGTGKLRFTLGTYGRPGPPLQLRVEAGGRAIARGRLAGGWRQGVVRVPISPRPAHEVDGVRVCLSQAGGRIAYAGQPSDPAVGARVKGRAIPAQVSIAELLPGRPSLLDLTSRITHRYGEGNAGWLGGWTWIAMAVAVLAAIALAGIALWRHARAPVAACVGVAVLASLTWALLTPPFQIPDEIAHVSYVQVLTETGRLPHEDYARPVYSPQENALLGALRFYNVIGRAEAKPPWTAAEGEPVRAAERADLSRTGSNATVASSNPPLYYLLEAPVYGATRWTSLLAQVLPMRLLSVALAGLTVFFVFGFLRELLPGSPWTWTAGALAVAFQPVFGFITGGVNPDALLFACSALTFFAMARLLRRGLSLRRMLLLAAAVAAGVLTKPLYLALVPAAAAAALVALIRGHRRERADWRGLGRIAAAGIAVAAVPILLYQLIGSAAFAHGYFQAGTTASSLAGTSGVPVQDAGLRHELSYIWQLFLPRLPTMNELFPPPGSLPLRTIWFDGLVGQFGWVDYSFAGWVTGIAVWVALPILAFAVAAVVVLRDRMRGRWLELGCYALALVGVVAVVGTSQWRATLTPGSNTFTQARYLLPLLALYGGVVAVALRLFGRRIGPVLAVLVVFIASLHEVSAMLLTIGRYYA